jgi:putative transposase
MSPGGHAHGRYDSSSHLNAYAERWVRSVKEECLSRLLLFREKALRHALTDYGTHYHHERNYQAKGNVLLIPPAGNHSQKYDGLMQCGERLGGFLKYYEREAA